MTTGTKIDASTLERLVPDFVESGDATGRATYDLHIERYEFAARHARPGRLLDCACGVGYGTRLLADHTAGIVHALGVDISDSAIAYAHDRYRGERVEFHATDALSFRDAGGFDTIVSLETIEHVPDPDALIAHLVSLLKPGGVLVASVPTTPSTDANPHHLTDFTETSFRRRFRRHGLTEIDCLRQVQPYNPFRMVLRTEKRLNDLRRNLPVYYLRHPKKLGMRLWSSAADGFVNKYLTVAYSLRKQGSINTPP
jgi:SAM-dependent methyltransferase